jgi:hypothetical protein
MPTPAAIPASVSRRSAARRCAGGGVPGSVVRHTRSSSVGIENVTETATRSAAAVRTSRSRTTIGLRVIMLNGVPCASSTSMQARVSRYRPSAGW